MTAFDWPSGVWPSEASVRVVRPQDVSPSLFGAPGQVVIDYRGRWRADLSFDRLPFEKVLQLEGLISKLNGAQNTIRVPVFSRLFARPELPDAIEVPETEKPFDDTGLFFDTGNGLITGRRIRCGLAGIGARRLVLRGFAPNREALKPAQAFSVAGQCFQVSATESVSAGPDGVFFVDVEPFVRRAIANDSPVELIAPAQEMRLVSPDPGDASTVKPRVSSYRLSFVEV